MILRRTIRRFFFYWKQYCTFSDNFYRTSKEFGLTCQYLVWPPLAFMTSWHLRRMESIRRRIKSWGMLFHSLKSAVWSWASVSGGFWLFLIRRPSSSQRCSIGDKSGNIAGQGNTWIWLFSKKVIEMCATWQRTLSCWKTWLKRCQYTLLVIT